MDSPLYSERFVRVNGLKSDALFGQRNLSAIVLVSTTSLLVTLVIDNSTNDAKTVVKKLGGEREKIHFATMTYLQGRI